MYLKKKIKKFEIFGKYDFTNFHIKIRRKMPAKIIRQ